MALVRSKEHLHEETEVSSAWEYLIDLCKGHHAAQDEQRILNEIRQKSPSDIQDLESSFDQALREVDALIEQKAQAIQIDKDSFHQNRSLLFVSLVFLASMFVHFDDHVEAGIALGTGAVIIIGIILYDLGKSLRGTHSYLTGFGLRLAILSAIITLADIVVTIVH